SSDDIDISDTSNSPKRNWRQNISDGCTAEAMSRRPSASTRPSSSGRVLGLSERATLRSSCAAAMALSFTGSLGLDVEGVHDRLPFANVGLDQAGEVLRRAAERLGAELGQRCLEVGRLHRLVDLAVELGD